MPAEVGLFLDEERTIQLPIIALGEVVAPEEFEEVFEGTAVKIYAANIGTTNLREISVHLKGEGAKNVQLATDFEGAQGIWAAPGESIFIGAGTVFPTDTFEFWARGVFNAGDAEGRLPLTIVFEATSIG